MSATSRCPFDAAVDTFLRVGRDVFQQPRPDGSFPRQFHRKAHACVRAKFTVEPPAEGALRRGLFAKAGAYPAMIRFSNAMMEQDEIPDVRGMAIKLKGVEGEVCEGAPPGHQDFILVSQPAMPFQNVSDAALMFKELERAGKLTPAKMALPRYVFHTWNPFRARWAYVRLTLAAAWQTFTRVPLASMSYFSGTPYQLGETAVKYECHPDGRAFRPKKHRRSRFRDALQASLRHGPVGFNFFVRPAGPHDDPVNADAAAWTGSLVQAGRIEIPAQEIAETFGLEEKISFNPWNCLKAHTPLGGINAARRIAYRASAERRGATASFPSEI